MIYCYLSQACTSETIDQVGIALLVFAGIVLAVLGIAVWRDKR